MLAVDQMAFQMGVIMGALFAGVACGFMPLGAGYRRGRIILGCVGFGLCILAGLAGGLILALPLALILSLGIRCVPKAAPNFPTAESMGYVNNNPYARGQSSAFGREVERVYTTPNTQA